MDEIIKIDNAWRRLADGSGKAGIVIPDLFADIKKHTTDNL